MLKNGTTVTNKMGWTGIVCDRPRHWRWKIKKRDPSVVYVFWRERKEMMDGKGNSDGFPIRDPVTSARIEDLTLTYSSD